MKPETKKFLILVGVVSLFTVPIFRSGGRTGLTGFQWIKEHSIWGSPIQYVPEEDYHRELEGVKITTEVQPVNGHRKAMAYYQISKASAKELVEHHNRD